MRKYIQKDRYLKLAGVNLEIFNNSYGRTNVVSKRGFLSMNTNTILVSRLIPGRTFHIGIEK